MDDLSGVVLNPNFETYKLPGIADVPELRSSDQYAERGVIGIGEPATVRLPPHRQRRRNAIGVRVSSLPSPRPRSWPRWQGSTRHPT